MNRIFTEENNIPDSAALMHSTFFARCVFLFFMINMDEKVCTICKREKQFLWIKTNLDANCVLRRFKLIFHSYVRYGYQTSSTAEKYK